MNSRKPILILQACLTTSVALVTVILVANPTHSHIVRRDISVNKLCGDERLYFKETGKCYPAQKKGPCGELMVLEPSNDDDNVGECNCEYIKGALQCPQRPTVFWKQESRCYHIYAQVIFHEQRARIPYLVNLKKHRLKNFSAMLKVFHQMFSKLFYASGSIIRNIIMK
ncbi:unnamed protein product [Allacma fusca]|uniref:Uncharacterized protein n=1 Tax=Allacma fusca TaxID=39272 RepID=A0A8J2KL34_9HEXA|nr:unnamed protein product [Allacma fusca]